MNAQKPTDGFSHVNQEEDDCPFCPGQLRANVVEELGTAMAIEDKHPVTPGHLLVLPRRHTPNFFTMTLEERRDAESLLVVLRERILQRDPSVAGFNLGANCGETAGQTIMHAHLHLIPRRRGDTPNPRGGIRGVIPEKMSY